MHDTDSNFTLKAFACTAVIKNSLTIALHTGFFHRIEDVILTRSVKYRRCHMNTQTQCSHTQMDFKHLSDVHP
ncbi:hypothetical protein D3C71_2192490 [compost metagenome]